MKTITYKDLIQELKMDDLRYDPWGTAMCAFFTCAAELQYRDNMMGTAEVPASWSYMPSPVGGDDPRDFDDSRAHVMVSASTEDLIKFGNLLNRFTGFCELAGKDY